MTTTAELFGIVVQSLTGTTEAGGNVFSALDWPTWDNSYPCIYIHPPVEDKESLGRVSGPQFNVTATVTIETRFQAPSSQNWQAPFDTAAATVEAALSRIGTQIEQQVINFDSLMALLQQFPFIRTRMTVSAEGEQHIGNLITEIGMEYYQGPEDFYQTPTVPLDQITVTADLTNIYDPTGTYLDPPFPSEVTAAPRTTGPDGRAEGSLDFPNLQAED